MRLFGIGPTEMVIILIILGLNAIPGWAMFRVSQRVGYAGGSRWIWAIAYLFFGWLAMIVFALSDWPRPSGPAARASAPQ